jgi:hypothetical protein
MQEEKQNLPIEVLSAIPQKEKLLWSGKPSWRGLAYHSFGLKYLILYFLGTGFFSISQMNESFLLAGFIVLFYPYLISGILAGLVLSLLAYFQAINTSYVITEKRIVIRSGAALIFLLNAPFKKIASIDKQLLKNGTLNVSFSPISKKRIPFFLVLA